MEAELLDCGDGEGEVALQGEGSRQLRLIGSLWEHTPAIFTLSRDPGNPAFEGSLLMFKCSQWFKHYMGQTKRNESWTVWAAFIHPSPQPYPKPHPGLPVFHFCLSQWSLFNIKPVVCGGVGMVLLQLETTWDVDTFMHVEQIGGWACQKPIKGPLE